MNIGLDTLRAACGAHQGDQHGGRFGRDCPTCRRYAGALATAYAAVALTPEQIGAAVRDLLATIKAGNA